MTTDIYQEDLFTITASHSKFPSLTQLICTFKSNINLNAEGWPPSIEYIAHVDLPANPGIDLTEDSFNDSQNGKRQGTLGKYLANLILTHTDIIAANDKDWTQRFRGYYSPTVTIMARLPGQGSYYCLWTSEEL